MRFSVRDEDGDNVVIEFCGDKRPRAAPELVVKASDKPYVTIHDYVSAVHPWLLGLHNDIFLVKNVFNGLVPLPPRIRSSW